MAKHLARIHGTEEDKVNCPFYFKIGACRHSDRCSRLHHKPAFSQTLLLKHLYQHPVRQAELLKASINNNINNPQQQQQQSPPVPPSINPEDAMEDFLCFFEDLYMELSKFGHLEGLYVADNMGDHMIGHVYVKFSDEEQAGDALQVLQGRYYDGRPIQAEFSPVIDFREARCRDFDEEACQRGGFCNFLHVKPVPIPLLRSLEEDAEADRRAFMESQQQQQLQLQQQQQQQAERKKSEKRGSSSKRDGSSSKKRKHREDRDRHSHRHHHRSSSGSKRSKRHRRSRSGSDNGSGNDDDDDDDRSYSSASDVPSPH